MLSTTPPKGRTLGATHSDLAFSGNLVIQGNYNGFEIYDISNPSKPVLMQTYLCPASQNDVSVYRNLLFMSSEATNSRDRLRLRRRARAGQQAARARHPRVRHRRRQASQARDDGADVPRIAHAHGRAQARRRHQRLHLRLGHGRRPLGGRSAGLRGRRHRRSEHRALPSRSDQGADEDAGPGGHRQLAAHLPGSAGAAGEQRTRTPRTSAIAKRRRPPRRRAESRRGAADPAAGAATSRRRRAGRISATTSPCIRKSASRAARAPASACCSTSTIRSTRFASTPSPTPTCRSGTRRRSTTTAPRCCSATSGAAAVSRAAARPTSWSGAPTRSSPSTNNKLKFHSLLQAARAADVAGELRRAQRLADPDSRPRHHGAVVVSGRPVGVRLDRHRPSEGDRVLRSRSGRRRRAW